MPVAVVNEMSGIEKAAVLMVSLGTAKSAEVFKHLDRDEIKKLSAGIIALRQVDPETKATVLAEFSRARALAARDTTSKRNFAAELMESVLEVEQVPASFEDLVALDRPTRQRVLEEIERRTLCLALKAAGNDVKEAVFSHFNSVQAESLKNEIEQIGAVKLREIEEAQDKIAAVITAIWRRGTEATR